MREIGSPPQPNGPTSWKVDIADSPLESSTDDSVDSSDFGTPEDASSRTGVELETFTPHMELGENNEGGGGSSSSEEIDVLNVSEEIDVVNVSGCSSPYVEYAPSRYGNLGLLVIPVYEPGAMLPLFNIIRPKTLRPRDVEFNNSSVVEENENQEKLDTKFLLAVSTCRPLVDFAEHLEADVWPAQDQAPENNVIPSESSAFVPYERPEGSMSTESELASQEETSGESNGEPNDTSNDTSPVTRISRANSI